MRKTSMIVGSLFLLAVCTGCGKSDYAVTPENVALYAQGSSENSFFQLFGIFKSNNSADADVVSHPDKFLCHLF